MSTNFYTCIFFGHQVELDIESFFDNEGEFYSNNPEIEIFNSSPMHSDGKYFLVARESFIDRGEWSDEEIVVLNDFDDKLDTWTQDIFEACERNNWQTLTPRWHYVSYIS